jgi:imidazolonepropionase-like amidohydrolase
MNLTRTLVALALLQLAPLLPASATVEQVTVIRNARVFDGVAAQRSVPQDVLIRGDRIEAIGKSLTIEPGAREIDAGGRTLMPGLIDAHAHIMLQLSVGKSLSSDAFYYAYVSTLAAKSFLDSGFTTVRDMSGNSFALKQAIDEGVVPGPRIYPSGAMISQTAGHSDHRSSADPSRLIDPTSRSHLEELGMTVVADGRSEVLLAARENLRRGATQIKIAVGGGVASYADPLDVTQYTDDEIRAAVEAAADWGTYVAAHVYNSEGIRRAIDNGVRSIEHANLVDRETLKYMKEKGAWLSPQVLVFQSEIRGLTPDQQAKQRQAFEGIDQLMAMAREVGFENIVFGADVVTNLDTLARIGDELTLRRRWFEPVEILRQATSKSGTLLALSGPRNPYGPLGVIRKGAVADILLVDGDPLDDISVLANPSQNLRLIMKGGKIYKNTL